MVKLQIENVLRLTCGVNCPITNGTMNPVVDAMPFVKAAIGPAKFGLKSIGTTRVDDGIIPWAPTEMMKKIPTRLASQPACAAAIKKELSRIAAGK